MKINKIKYKGVVLDSFCVYQNDIFIGEEGSEIDSQQGLQFGSYICPICTKKHGFYREVDRSPESVQREIEFYRGSVLEGGLICGIEGCHNGFADDAYLDDDVEIITD